MFDPICTALCLVLAVLKMCPVNAFYSLADVCVHRAAALCLAQALLKCPVPKSVASASDCRYVGLMDGSASPHLKETLIAWLLMTDQSDEMDESSHPHPIICRSALC